MTPAYRRDAGIAASFLMAFGYKPVSMFRIRYKECTNYSEGYSVYSVAVIPNGYRHLENVHVRIGTVNGLPSIGFTESRNMVQETREKIMHQQYAQASMRGCMLAVPGLYAARDFEDTDTLYEKKVKE